MAKMGFRELPNSVVTIDEIKISLARILAGSVLTRRQIRRGMIERH